MGLDSVEFIMDIEKEFGIRFTDIEAEQIYRVQDLYNAVYEKVKESGISEEEVQARANKIIHEGIGIPYKDIVPEAIFTNDFGID